jgi:hypothetical protein
MGRHASAGLAASARSRASARSVAEPVAWNSRKSSAIARAVAAKATTIPVMTSACGTGSPPKPAAAPRSVEDRYDALCNQMGNQCDEIINLFGAEPIGSPLVGVLNDCRGFSGRPDEYGIGHALPNAPCEGRTDSRKLFFLAAIALTRSPSSPRQHEVGRRGRRSRSPPSPSTWR